MTISNFQPFHRKLRSSKSSDSRFTDEPKRFKIAFQIIFVCLLIELLFPSVVSAHILQSDGSIGAVLHIDPEDDPIAGAQSSFFFEFKDKQNAFQPKNCDCTFEIDEKGKNIYTQPLFQSNPNPSLSNASIFYTFPQRDVYQVKVIGKPVIPHAFQSFTLVYDIRVERTTLPSRNTTSGGLNWFSVRIIPLGVIVLSVFFIMAKKWKKTIVKGGEKENKNEN